MGKSLLIVESPTKAKTLSKYLGKDYIVKASVGHIKDLPKSKLGIDIDDQFRPEYRVIRGKAKIVKELNEAAAKADAVFLGPDPDREGEAIAWHIAQELCTENKPVHRVLFYELTRGAIFEALRNPQQLNQSLFESQQTRRILDRLVGYLISPLLWEKVKKGLSAGRVQSVALRLVCDREKEIRAFDAEEYWSIGARLEAAAAAADAAAPLPFEAQLWRYQGKACKVTGEQQAQDLVERLRGLNYSVATVERKTRRRNPAPPFITSTLQQDAARKLRFSARQTMRVAQKLYEGMEVGEEGAVGLITYMRTDSTRLSDDAVQAARAHIKGTWGEAYLPARKVVYRAKEGAQDAHEAIRPTAVERTPEALAPFLTPEALALYTLIWKRFVASQMKPAVIDQTTIDIAAGPDFLFRATGSVIQFYGFMALYQEGSDTTNGDAEDRQLPPLREGQALTLLDLLPKQHFTQPPPRFTEAALIKELEERGIGRPSTYATIISTIMEREYAKLERRSLLPTELGMLISDLLVNHFPDILDVAFTARMEQRLDEVEQGRQPWLDLLQTFYDQFSGALAKAQAEMVHLKSIGWETGLVCPECGRALHIKLSRNGPFLACSGYPACSFSSSYQRDDKGQIQLVEATTSGELCDKCGSPMVVKRGRFGNFLACSGYPKCKNTKPITLGIPCAREGCGGELVERVSKRGRAFYGCSKYPECHEVFWNRPVRIKCPQCGSPFLLEKVSKKDGKHWLCPNKGCGYVHKGD